MKLRNFLIVLFAVLMVFAIASCKHEPKVEPQPDAGDGIYQIQITEGVDNDYWNRDKLKLFFEEPVKAGDTITLKYRSERDVYQWDIRNETEKIKWVYETHKGYGDAESYFVDPVEGDDGWYTLTYTFADKVLWKNSSSVEVVTDFTESDGFGIYLRGNFVRTDLVEIKDVKLNGKAIKIDEDNITSKAVLTGTEEYPKVDHDWSVKNYTVLFAKGTPGEVDKTPIAEKVVAGGFVTGAPVAKEGYTLTIYTDTAHTAIFDPTTPITEEKIFYYEYVGVPRTINFVLNGGAFAEDAEIPETIPNGDVLTAPPAPKKEGEAFAVWCTDEALQTPYNFASEVLGDLTLYAKYGTPVTVTFDAQNGEEPTETVVALGYPVTAPETPVNGTKMFLGWYTTSACETEDIYNFATPITEAKTLYAGWINTTDVTLYIGDAEPVTFKAALDVALSEENENLVVVDDNIGFVFDGWYTDASCETPYDFETVVTAPLKLYGQWVEGTLYQFKATIGVASGLYDYDKFVLSFSDSKVNAGDVLSFRYRSTTELEYMSVRGQVDWVKQNESAGFGMTTNETKDDGWTYVTYKFPATDRNGADVPANAWFRFDFGSWTIVVGDVLEVQDFALNGVPFTITADNVNSYVKPTVKVIEGGSYEWDDLSVSFVMGEHATAIEPKTVEFGATIAAPEVTVADGYHFSGFFADNEFENEYNFALPIIEDTIIYARVGEKRTVTFDSGEGSAVPSQELISGDLAVEPEDPTKSGSVFKGWFTENTFDNEYNFDTPVTADITLYAKWIASKKVTINYNYTGAPEATVIDVEEGAPMAQPKNPVQPGAWFAGWYDADTDGSAVDFEAAVTANKTIYAHWTYPTTFYRFTSSKSAKRLGLVFETEVAPKKGDVIAFKFKTPAGKMFDRLYLREWNGGQVFVKNDDGSINPYITGPDANGWYTFIYEYGEKLYSGSAASYPANGLLLEPLYNTKFAADDVIDILGFSYNGVALAITESNIKTSSSDHINPALTTVAL